MAHVARVQGPDGNWLGYWSGRLRKVVGLEKAGVLSSPSAVAKSTRTLPPGHSFETLRYRDAVALEAALKRAPQKPSDTPTDKLGL